MVFKVNNIDYSGHVIAGTYDVHEDSVYEEVRDGYGVRHRNKIRDEVTGSFDMLFRTLDEFKGFAKSVKNAKDKSTGAVRLLVRINNAEDELREIDAFVKFYPKRNRNGKWKDYMERFTLELEER